MLTLADEQFIDQQHLAAAYPADSCGSGRAIFSFHTLLLPFGSVFVKYIITQYNISHNIVENIK